MALRMLINAIHEEETRVAIANDDKLLELEIERTYSGQLRGNVYKAAITRIEPSLQAAFLDIGSERNGFLQINDINASYFRNWDPEEKPDSRNRPIIQDVLRAKQELIVQVVKDGRDLKGATLTTNLSLPGRYLVLMVGNQRGGVSRKIIDEKQRNRLRHAVQSLRVPPGMGVIVRTAGINKTSTELQRDLDSLLDTWHNIVKQSQQPGAPKVVYTESGLAIRTLRDYLTPDITEILVDHEPTFEQIRDFVARVVPESAEKVKFYEDPKPLFSTFHLDNQIDATSQSQVSLPSGGSIVISPTEAIVAIDVNSGRATSQSDVEETAFATNKEAAELLAKQLRLRDLGGLIVIDFIDMWDRRHRQAVERTLRDAVRNDKAKVEMGRISKFGLLEMSRQRLKASIASQSSVGCPHCGGSGIVKSPDVAALEALRKIQSAVFAGGVTGVRIRMSPAAALFVLNDKRQFLTDLERHSNVKIVVYADGRMKPADYELELETSGRDMHVGAVDRAIERQREKAIADSEKDSDKGRGQRRGRSGGQGRGSRGRGRSRRGGSSGGGNRGRQGQGAWKGRRGGRRTQRSDSSDSQVNGSNEKAASSTESGSNRNLDGAGDNYRPPAVSKKVETDTGPVIAMPPDDPKAP